MNQVLIELGVSPENSAQSAELGMKFNPETIFVSRLFTRFISDWHPKNLLKIAILIVDSYEKKNIIPPNRFTKACAIYNHFELAKYDTERDQSNRYKLLLDFMLNTLIEASKQFNWPTEIFTEAYAKVISTNFTNEFSLLGAKWSPDKKRSASLSVRVDKHQSTIFLEIKDLNGQVQKKSVIEVAQHKDDFNITQSIHWVDNNELIISNNDKEINFKYSLGHQALDVFFTPKIHDESYLQDELKLLSPSTPKAACLEIINKRIESIKKNSAK